jgi:hypothetical protein
MSAGVLAVEKVHQGENGGFRVVAPLPEILGQNIKLVLPEKNQ